MNWLNKVYKPVWTKSPKTAQQKVKRSSPAYGKYPRELRYQIGIYLAQFHSTQYRFTEGKLYKRSTLNPKNWIFIASLYGEDSYWTHSFEIWNREREWLQYP